MEAWVQPALLQKIEEARIGPYRPEEREYWNERCLFLFSKTMNTMQSVGALSEDESREWMNQMFAALGDQSGAKGASMTQDPTVPSVGFGPEPQREPGWAYLYLASELRHGLAAYDTEYLRHVQRVAIPTSEKVVDPFVDFKVRLDQVQATVHQGIIPLNAETSKKAFGLGGGEADEVAVRTMAGGLVEMYVSLLSWAALTRSINVPPEWVPVYAALAEMADTPIGNLRQYSLDWDQEAEALARARRSGEPYKPRNMTLNIAIGDDAMEHFMAASESLKASLVSGGASTPQEPQPRAVGFGPEPSDEPGWAYLYFASELRHGIAAYDAEYLRHVQRLVQPSGETVVDPVADLRARTRRLRQAVRRGITPVTSEMSKKAFGPDGRSGGDEEAIRTVTGSVVVMYAQLLEWAEETRSVKVPPEWAQVYGAEAELADASIEAIRQFAIDWDERAQLVAAAVRDRGLWEGEPLTLTVTIDRAAKDRFDAALDALKAQRASGTSAP
jgi:hypothetical protein